MTVEDDQSTRKRKNFWFHPAGVTPPLVLLAATKTAGKPCSISIPLRFRQFDVSGYRPKSVLARHAPYFLNSWIKIYTFNSRQQPTYQHSTFVSSSLPSLSDLFPFQIRKTRPQRLPPFFFLFRKAWLSTPVFCDTYPSQQLSLYMAYTNLRTTNAHRSKRRWKQIYE